MLLLGLLACGCPTFAEMEVCGDADATFLAEVQGALDDFAAWTGREGVCVPEVRVEEELGDGRVQGRYRGPHSAILLSRDAVDPRTVTLHELCHALDEREGLADPEVFEPVEADDDYPTRDLRIAEGFADRCQEGAEDLGLLAGVDDACGPGSLDAADRYLYEHVYTAAPHTQLSEEPAPWRLTVDGLTLPQGWTIYDGAVAGGRAWLLVDWFVVEEDQYAIGVAEVLGADVGEPVRLPAEAPSGGRLARTDGALVALVTDGESTLAYAVDEVPTPLSFEGLPRYPDTAAVQDGVLYVRGFSLDGVATTGAWSLSDGAPVAVPASEGWLWALYPTSAGLEARDRAGVLRLEAVGWTRLTTFPAGASSYAHLSERDRLSFPGGVPAVFDLEAGTWRLPPAACYLRGQRSGPVLEDPAGTTRILGASWSEDGATLPVIEVTPA